MNENKALAVFEDYKIRRVYDEKAEIWYLSVIDIIAALIQQPDYQAARNDWKVLKNRLKKEGSQAVTDCNRLKMIAQVALCASVSSSPERASASGRVVDSLSPLWLRLPRRRYSHMAGQGVFSPVSGYARKVLTRDTPIFSLKLGGFQTINIRH
jgi:hypothetical protein